MFTNDPNFPNVVLLTNEAVSRRDRIGNSHAQIEYRHHQQFILNVWFGIVGDNLIEPFLLPNRLNGASYLAFLGNELSRLLRGCTHSNTKQAMHDGVHAHFVRNVVAHLNNTFG